MGKDEDFLFPNLVKKGAAISYEAARDQFRKGLKAAGIENIEKFGLHSMRRGSVTALTQAGVSDHLVQKHMRVVSNSTVRRYATLSQEKLGKISRVVFRASAHCTATLKNIVSTKYGAYFLCSTLLCGEPYPDVRCRSHPNTRTWVLGCLVSNRNEVLFWKPLDGKS